MRLHLWHGAWCIIILIEEHSSWATVINMRQKSDGKTSYLKFGRMSERRVGQVLRAVRSDRGGEYLSNAMVEHFRSLGFDRQSTLRYSLHQIGFVQCMSRTLLDLMRAMLQGKNLAKCLGQNPFLLSHMSRIELLVQPFLLIKPFTTCGKYSLLFSFTCAFLGLNADLSPLEEILRS